MNYFTESFVPSAYTSGMTRKEQRRSLQPSFDVQDDLRTDYALIATGIGAALAALAYLLLT